MCSTMGEPEERDHPMHPVAASKLNISFLLIPSAELIEIYMEAQLQLIWESPASIIISS